VKASATRVLREAARERHSGETFEKSLARAVKSNGGTYQDYIDLIGKVRERERREGKGLPEAADRLSRSD